MTVAKISVPLLRNGESFSTRLADVEGGVLGRSEESRTSGTSVGIEPRTLELPGRCDTILATPPISLPLLNGRAVDRSTLYLGFESREG
ncbi:hypothetical protein OUZ56_030811 [Daphnia magna]|uniref:Uncharacterized protein n=1 Tax=Daphnia magna TaxID=35525 RepID=A0ABQ9ZSD5_9CRUS|nr:hypothetical protein OUZ56_030811 [Daphnia magna]